MWKARRGKHLFGGAMRQAGIVAAAGVHALDHHVERLADDHARAARLAGALRAAGVPVANEVETNFVQIDVEPLGLTREQATERARAEGVLISPTGPRLIRAVTHLDVDDDAVERAAELIPRALGLLARV